MKRSWIAGALFITLALLAACKTAPPPPPPPPVAPPPPPPPPPARPVEPPPPPPPVVDTREKPWWENPDLVKVNDEARRQGFIGDVLFDFNKSELRPEARERLERNARWLREHPEFVVTIEGHCDERGTNEYNIALGERRSTSASDFITAAGVDANRMRNISYGEERPVCSESTEGCWQRNRRAHFVITGRR